MLTKTIALLTLIAGLGIAARAVSTIDAPKKHGVVTVEVLGWYPQEDGVDCEYVIAPDHATQISGGESC